MEALTVSYVRDELSRLTVPHKTIIVNNAATEESNAALCNGLNAMLVDDQNNIDTMQNVFVLPATDNLGFARGNNFGAEFCRKTFASDYLLFSNNDIKIPSPAVAAKLMEVLEANPEAGVVGPKVVGLDGVEQGPFPYESCWEREVWRHWATFLYSKQKHAQRFHLNYGQQAKEGFHHHVHGSFFMVRATDFYACGMMDPNTFLYAEEKILAERMKAIGKKMYYYPQVSVIHAHGATTNRYSRRRGYDWQAESNLYYYRTYCHTTLPILLLARITHALVRLRI
ncbi:MAG: glycosyltransferase family 2 protein [Prevotellaceae bacterium]|nr:glycosyltransferase family 2 protein [Prevotellaceae bacterium]